MSDPSPNPPAETQSQPIQSQAKAQTEAETVEIPADPEAQAADRAGFKFLAVGFLFFFVIIAVCASVVALVMKRMGI